MQSVVIRPQATVFQAYGPLNAANADEFQQQLLTTVSSQQCSALLVDLSRTDSLDSAGLMALVSALTASQQMNKKFGLCGVSPSIRIIFELTQLDRVFEFFDTRSAFEAAIAS